MCDVYFFGCCSLFLSLFLILLLALFSFWYTTQTLSFPFRVCGVCVFYSQKYRVMILYVYIKRSVTMPMLFLFQLRFSVMRKLCVCVYVCVLHSFEHCALSRPIYFIHSTGFLLLLTILCELFFLCSCSFCSFTSNSLSSAYIHPLNASELSVCMCVGAYSTPLFWYSKIYFHLIFLLFCVCERKKTSVEFFFRSS